MSESLGGLGLEAWYWQGKASGLEGFKLLRRRGLMLSQDA